MTLAQIDQTQKHPLASLMEVTEVLIEKYEGELVPTLPPPALT